MFAGRCATCNFDDAGHACAVSGHWLVYAVTENQFIKTRNELDDGVKELLYDGYRCRL